MTNRCFQGDEDLDFKLSSHHQGQQGIREKPAQGEAGKGELSFKREGEIMDAYIHTYIDLSLSLYIYLRSIMQINAYLNLHKFSSFLAHRLHIIRFVLCILVR